jgi:betaine-aldehyde dehydrogenase
MKEYKLWIDGEWKSPKNGQSRIIENPADESQVAIVAEASKEDVGIAVESANKAFYDGRWSGLTPGERSNILWKFADLLEANKEELGQYLESAEPTKL